MRQPLWEMGSLAVQTLDRIIGGQPSPPHAPLSTTPMIRSSCGCRPGHDPSPQGPQAEGERLSWIRTERVIGMLQIFGERLMNAQTIQDVLNTVAALLPVFSLSTFYLVLFEDWPRSVKTLPRRLRLVYSRHGDHDFQAGPYGTPLNFSSLVERCFAEHSAKNGRILVSGLNYGDEEIGLLFFDASEPYLLHMTSFATVLSSALKRISVIDLQRHHTDELEREVAVRTRDLITINRLLQEEVRRRTAIQRELEARQKDLETILEAMPIPLVVTDLGWGSVHYANRAFHLVSRRRPGRRPLRTFFERSPVLAPDGSCTEGELVFKASQGEPRTMVVQTAPIRFRGDGEVVVGFLDVTVQKALERDLLTISEHERETLGRDLHDDICQRIAGVSFLMTALSRALEQESHPLAGRSREASANLADSLQRVRQYSRGLFPIELEDSGLLTSLRGLVSRSPRDEGPELHFETNLADQTPLLDPDAELQLYRIAQEALNNAVVHSGCTLVKISLVRGRKKLVLEVADNGSGLGPSRWGIGMRSMQYRSSQIGASFNCVSDLGVGTKIRVEVPLIEMKKETQWVRRSS